jgi:hypothetical protein
MLSLPSGSLTALQCVAKYAPSQSRGFESVVAMHLNPSSENRSFITIPLFSNAAFY